MLPEGGRPEGGRCESVCLLISLTFSLKSIKEISTWVRFALMLRHTVYILMCSWDLKLKRFLKLLLLLLLYLIFAPENLQRSSDLEWRSRPCMTFRDLEGPCWFLWGWKNQAPCLQGLRRVLTTHKAFWTPLCFSPWFWGLAFRENTITHKKDKLTSDVMNCGHPRIFCFGGLKRQPPKVQMWVWTCIKFIH